MPSSTSSSKVIRQNWVVIFLGAALLGGLGLAFQEIAWRSLGYQTTIVDSQALWSVEREKLSGGPGKTLALLGGSRMQADVNPESIERRYPGYRVAQLAVNGTCANETLHDLAADESFTGVVLLDLTELCVLFGESPSLTQAAYVDYFRNTWSWNAKINRWIATRLQETLVVVDPNLNLVKTFGQAVVENEIRPKRYWRVEESRWLAYDFNQLDTLVYNSDKLEKVSADYREKSPYVYRRSFRDRLMDLSFAVRKIRKRGGRVVAIRMPVSEAHWKLDQEFYPRNVYWDLLHERLGAETIHFKDYPSLEAYPCPDTSHLDYRSVDRFTEALMRIVDEKVGL